MASAAERLPLVDFQQRGCRHSLLTARIQDALELGVEHAFSDVLPQSESASHCARIDFQALMSSQLWVEANMAI